MRISLSSLSSGPLVVVLTIFALMGSAPHASATPTSSTQVGTVLHVFKNLPMGEYYFQLGKLITDENLLDPAMGHCSLTALSRDLNFGDLLLIYDVQGHTALSKNTGFSDVSFSLSDDPNSADQISCTGLGSDEMSYEEIAKHLDGWLYFSVVSDESENSNPGTAANSLFEKRLVFSQDLVSEANKAIVFGNGSIVPNDSQLDLICSLFGTYSDDDKMHISAGTVVNVSIIESEFRKYFKFPDSVRETIATFNPTAVDGPWGLEMACYRNNGQVAPISVEEIQAAFGSYATFQ